MAMIVMIMAMMRMTMTADAVMKIMMWGNLGARAAVAEGDG